jgi:hypothetical protein
MSEGKNPAKLPPTGPPNTNFSSRTTNSQFLHHFCSHKQKDHKTPKGKPIHTAVISTNLQHVFSTT